MTENWYMILELEFDPPVQDEAIIAAKIDEKAKFWAANFNNFKLGPQYRAWHQNIPQIKKDMIGPDNIRAELAKDACDKVYGPVDKLLKTIGKKGYITEDEGDKLAAKLKVKLDLVRKRVQKLGLEWRKGSGEKHQKLYEKYYKSKPLGAANFDGMAQLLASFQTDNLYDFLYAGTTIDAKTARNMPCDRLLTRSQEKKKQEFSGHTSVAGSGAKLCGQCELIFKTDAEKKKYDEYLEYMRRKKVFDEIKQMADISGAISPDIGDDFISRMTEILRDRDLASDLVAAFCAVEKIAYGRADDGKKSANLKVCRCGCINDVSDGRQVCRSCGMPLVLNCPKCGTKSDANVRVCKCGFLFENIDKAKALCDLAESALAALDFAAAKLHLKDAESYWPGIPKATELKRRLTDYESRVGAEVSKMRKAMAERRYYEAQRQYQSICRLFPGYKDAEMENQCTQAVRSAQTLFMKAQSSGQEREVLELCAQAYELCADLPGVKDLMGRYPPAPVTGFSVAANPNTRVNLISWRGSSEDKSLRYVLVRSESGWVQHVSDGEILYRGSADSYGDKDIKPGTVYYYNVFADRAGVYSKGAQGEVREVINLFEIGTLTATAGNETVNLSWETIPRGATAEIYLLGPNNTERLLASVSSDGYLARNLPNGTPCRFKVALAYTIGGKRRVTRGVVSPSITPEKPAEPIDTIRVKPGQGDDFELIWYQEDNLEVRLYGSKQKPRHQCGDVVAVSVLEQEMRLLQTKPLTAATRQTLAPNEKGLTITYPSTEMLYVAPVVIKSDSATFGALARVVKGETVTIKDAFAANGQLNILIDPPKNASGFLVLYRHDRFPGDLSDTGCTRKYIPMGQYKLTDSLVIPQLTNQKYYLSVFAEFRRDGDKDYSPGTDRLFDNAPKANISYSITYRKPLFGAKELILKFTADTRQFQLPEIDVMSRIGSVPMFKNAANLIQTIPAQPVDGELTVNIPMTPGKNTYIKAFFHNEADATGSQLRLQSGSSHQIT